ncbi:hypothetical protein GCM10009836_59640 [Pseudonocardia ailaonensis]|uniref:Uncharacterized protein n=1 Tax=Pseudonocardia ailaonensis TaxID=367279 RepID=A0ABN2NIY3_9PSEU
MQTLRSAMNHLEDTATFEDAHTELDRAGRLARQKFAEGCHLDLDEDLTYHQSCPVALAHNRVGLSPGMIVRESQCSICESDPEDCIHITGRTYDGERCVRIIKEADILEVSFVARPNQPDARINRVSVDIGRLKRGLGSDFHPGVPVLCDNCLTPCGGVYDGFNKYANL